MQPYQGESSRPNIQRESGACGSISQVGMPSAPARHANERAYSPHMTRDCSRMRPDRARASRTTSSMDHSTSSSTVWMRGLNTPVTAQTSRRSRLDRLVPSTTATSTAPTPAVSSDSDTTDTPPNTPAATSTMVAAHTANRSSARSTTTVATTNERSACTRRA